MTFDPSLQPKLDFSPAEEFIIEDLETLKVMSDPLRLRIRELMSNPCTVKQIAHELAIPATKLYYHINLLEKHGLIVLVDTRIVSGIIEKHYQVSAKSIRVANHLLSAPTAEGEESVQLTFNTLFEDAKTDLFESIANGTVDARDEAPHHHGAQVFSLRYRLTDTEAEALFGELRTLLKGYIEKSQANQEAKRDDVRVYKVFNVLFPTGRGDKPHTD